ncbi:cleavage stimulating factor 64 isoform X4 [Dendrobium catenatum]|uniref:cleavage stimulating factor 64 isoform X4 n=1 Tax=Dendrobium catenatum TaxID=906689 RepID=UPI0009F6FD45|nr:cleavage stimulating factor 64 isoform X4 [Dendrobium catenatum]
MENQGVDHNMELVKDWGGRAYKSVTDSQKSLAGHDAALHQPLGLPFAAKAASAMADVLNGSQKSSLQPELRNVIPTVSGSNNDPLTLYLAKMSRHQMDDVMLEMKALAERNEATAKQLLQGNPQLRKALVQALTMLGMETPQMMQMASSQKSHFAVQEDKLDLNPVTPSRHGQFPLHEEAISEAFFQLPEDQTKNASPTSVVLQHSFPQHVPLPAHPPSLPQNEFPSQGTVSLSNLNGTHQIQVCSSHFHLILQRPRFHQRSRFFCSS